MKCIKPLTIKDLREKLKTVFKENNKSIFKKTDLSIKNALKENNKINNEVLFKRIDKVVNDRLSEASGAILGGMQAMFNERFETFKSKFDNYPTV